MAPNSNTLSFSFQLGVNLKERLALGFNKIGQLTMLPRATDLLIIWFITSALHTMGRTEKKFEGDSLEVNNSQTLLIDTSKLRAFVDGHTIELHERLDNATFLHFPHQVAVLKFLGDIVFHNNSKVSIEGNRSLSIKSEHGDIYVGTNVSVTCSKVPDKGDTCLGGFMVNKTKCKDRIFSGLGPGGSLNKLCSSSYSTERYKESWCNNGAGHGGRGGVQGGEFKRGYGKSYGLQDFRTLVGGSSGNYYYSRNFTSFGGGAIEIEAINGSICIDSSIEASATKISNWVKLYDISGSSGGLIRLVAQEVEMTGMATLNADGSDGSMNKINQNITDNGGGGGGIIQVIADHGILYNLSLSPGKSYGCNNTNIQIPVEVGCLVYKESLKPEISGTKNCTDFIKKITWPVKYNEANSICANFKSKFKERAKGVGKRLSVDEQLDYILNHSISLQDSIGSDLDSKISEIFDLLGRLEDTSRENNFTGSQLQKVLRIFVTFNGIMHKIRRSPEEVKQGFSVLLGAASTVVSSRNQVNWKKIKKMPALAETLEDMASNIAKITDDYSNCTDLIDVQVTTFDATSRENFLFPDKSKLSSPTCFTTNEFIRIPKEALPSRTGHFKFITIIYKNIHRGLPNFIQQDERAVDSYMVVSSLSSYRLLSKEFDPIKVLKQPANIQFKLRKKENPGMCAFWNPDKREWDNKGLSSLDQSKTSTAICETTHLTSFAVLMQFQAVPLTAGEKLSLTIITYAGCGLSIMALLKTVITLIVFQRIETVSSERHKIHLNLSIALLIALVLFLMGTQAVGEKLMCQILAGLLHYFYLASFAWMLIEGIHLYLKVVKVFGVENIKITSYYTIGWVLPALIVIIPVIIKPYNYGTKYTCWLSLEDGFVWAFIGPVLAIIVINAFILGTVVKTVVMSASTCRSSDYSHIRAGIKGALVLMPLMGVTWVFGLLSVNRDTIVFQYLFAFTNSLQGVFIFLLHIMFSNEVRTAFKKRWERRQLSKESADYNASFTSTNEKSSNSASRTSASQTSNNTAKSKFARIKATLSFGATPRTSRVISVQPFSSKGDQPIIHIERKINKDASNKLASFKQDFEMHSSLNCPAAFQAEEDIPRLAQINNKRHRKTKDFDNN